MNENEKTVAIGVFEDRRHAKLAVDELLNKGFTLEQVGFVMKGGQVVRDDTQVNR